MPLRLRLKDYFCLSLIAVAVVWIYHRLVIVDPILQRDDQHILTHLHGLSAILSLLKLGQLFDLIAYQPVKDFSYFIDLFLKSRFALGTFHFSNVLIWIGTCLTVFSMLALIFENASFALGFTAVFALHPVFVGSVAWIAARKHLLSCFFIFLATFEVLRFQKFGGRKIWHGSLVLLLYILSILSQPITVLWPLWVLLYCYSVPTPQRREGLWWLAYACLPVLVIGGAANLYYYSHDYLVHTQTAKWVAGDIGGIPGLALGRYFTNFVFPAKLALVYYPGSIWNMAGLVGALIFFAATLMKFGKRKAGPWIFFFLFPLLPVTLKPTNVFVSDTYFLSASLGLLVLFGFWLHPWMQQKDKRRAFISASACILLLVLFVRSSSQASVWESDRELWRSSYETEPSPRSLAVVTRDLLQGGRIEDALHNALILEGWVPDDEDVPYLLAKSVYLYPKMDASEKIQLLLSHESKNPSYSNNPWFTYYLASLFAGEKDFTHASDLLEKIYRDEARLSGFEQELPIVTAEIKLICDLARRRDCQDAPSQARLLTRYWDEKLYLERLNQGPTRSQAQRSALAH